MRSRIRLDAIHDRHLIKIKAALGVCDIILPQNRRSCQMPLDIALVVFIAASFGAFAATLYWADLQTRGLGK